MSTRLAVALEIGSKRTFASAITWPGWSRAGRDEEASLEALLAYGSRYAAVVRGTASLRSPGSLDAFEIVERLAGDATTDFGAPGTPPTADSEPVTARELARLTSILRLCWGAFDAAADSAGGVSLRAGARGGGRDLTKIRAHVADAELAYLGKLGGKAPRGAGVEGVREGYLDALAARARGELPDVGPRGGSRWSARYAVRRSAWHALDHAWEIEDRSQAS